MSFDFTAALSGLRASSQALGVTGNNIANANTTAFKSSSTTFADLFNSSFGAPVNGAGLPLQVGNGVTVAATARNLSQGALNATNTPTNAGIQGNGYFVVSAPATGAQAFTRAGAFTLDRNGYLVTPAGQQLLGYAAVNNQIPPGSALTALKVPVGEIAAPVTTSEVTFRMNLNTSDATNTVFHATTQVYDSKGVAHTQDLAFTKQADGSYTIAATLDGKPAQLSADGGAAGATATMTFDGNGQLVTPAKSLSIVPDQTQLNGASLPSIDVNLYAKNPDGTLGAGLITNFSATSAVSSTEQNGFASGSLTGVTFASDGSGTLMAVYSNGQTRPLGQAALATFNAPDALVALGDNSFAQSVSSGPASIGAPSSGGRGAVVGGTLEQSNVDIASEFTDLIVEQRSYQANSRVINAVNQTMQELLQIT